MKFNRITDSVKILIYAASVIITCFMVAIGMNSAHSAKLLGGAADSKMNELYNDIVKSEITKYDNKTLYGSEVANMIKKHMIDYTSPQTAPFQIRVSTVSNPDVLIYSDNTHIKDISDFSSPYYIKPSAKFHCVIHRNENDVIDYISFTQQ